MRRDRQIGLRQLPLLLDLLELSAASWRVIGHQQFLQIALKMGFVGFALLLSGSFFCPGDIEILQLQHLLKRIKLRQGLGEQGAIGRQLVKEKLAILLQPTSVGRLFRVG